MQSVCVLMSTYNGEKYLREQIDSILNQKDVNVHLVVRDDGSTDKTRDVLVEYGKEISVMLQENVGCEKSFLELLHYQCDADYYAFADQDDYWHPKKLINEILAIETIEGPALAACNLMVCDSRLLPIRIMHTDDDMDKLLIRMKRDYLHSMHGCVLLWNRKMHKYINMYRPECLVPHDVWVCLLANALGEVHILKKPYIHYRLHDNNVSGYATNRIDRLKKGIRLYLGTGHMERDCFAQEVLKGYSEWLDAKSEGYKFLQMLSTYKTNLGSKIRLLNSKKIKEADWKERIFWRICICLNKY
ncbi:MAG: glycosyltransferase [Roseburia sp.]|nr:glycosyltransferase [Roseburia sp.]MCM1277887.1 glycosyltransferase [Robinsoniella sp.]